VSPRGAGSLETCSEGAVSAPARYERSVSSTIHPICLVLLGVLALAACYQDIRTRTLSDWLTLGGAGAGLLAAGLLGGWPGLRGALYGLATGAGVFALLWALGMLALGDVLLMGASGTLLGWPTVLPALFYVTVAGALLGVGLSLARGRLLRVLRNLAVAVTSTFRPRRPRVRLADLPTEEMPYAVAIAAGSLWAAASVYLPALRLL